jgi:hypothetical protein
LYNSKNSHILLPLLARRHWQSIIQSYFFLAYLNATYERSQQFLLLLQW